MLTFRAESFILEKDTIVSEYYNTKQDTGNGMQLIQHSMKFLHFFCHLKYQRPILFCLLHADKLIRAIKTPEISLYGLLPCFSMFNL